MVSAYSILTIAMNEDKDIKIETGEDVGLDDNIKAGAKAIGKKIQDPDKDTNAEYKQKGKRKSS